MSLSAVCSPAALQSTHLCGSQPVARWQRTRSGADPYGDQYATVTDIATPLPHVAHATRAPTRASFRALTTFLAQQDARAAATELHDERSISDAALCTNNPANEARDE